MMRNCNLKLQLQPSPPQPFPHQQQPLTIFYNGQVAVFDVTEFQARAIIMHASREMMRRSPSAGGDYKDAGDREEENSIISPSKYHRSTPVPQSTQMLSPSPSPTNASSMKRSLQQFLQKRRRRILATSPYNVQ